MCEYDDHAPIDSYFILIRFFFPFSCFSDLLFFSNPVAVLMDWAKILIPAHTQVNIYKKNNKNVRCRPTNIVRRWLKNNQGPSTSWTNLLRSFFLSLFFTLFDRSIIFVARLINVLLIGLDDFGKLLVLWFHEKKRRGDKTFIVFRKEWTNAVLWTDLSLHLRFDLSLLSVWCD